MLFVVKSNQYTFERRVSELGLELKQQILNIIRRPFLFVHRFFVIATDHLSWLPKSSYPGGLRIHAA